MKKLYLVNGYQGEMRLCAKVSPNKLETKVIIPKELTAKNIDALKRFFATTAGDYSEIVCCNYLRRGVVLAILKSICDDGNMPISYFEDSLLTTYGSLADAYTFAKAIQAKYKTPLASVDFMMNTTQQIYISLCLYLEDNTIMLEDVILAKKLVRLDMIKSLLFGCANRNKDFIVFTPDAKRMIADIKKLQDLCYTNINIKDVFEINLKQVEEILDVPFFKLFTIACETRSLLCPDLIKAISADIYRYVTVNGKVSEFILVGIESAVRSRISGKNEESYFFLLNRKHAARKIIGLSILTKSITISDSYEACDTEFPISEYTLTDEDKIDYTDFNNWLGEYTPPNKIRPFYNVTVFELYKLFKNKHDRLELLLFAVNRQGIQERAEALENLTLQYINPQKFEPQTAAISPLIIDSVKGGI